MCRPPARARASRGIALVLVLWALVLLSVLAGSFVYAVRGNTRLAANAVDIARAHALADGGVERGAFELLKPPTDLKRWQPDGRSHSYTMGTAVVRVTLDDESGRIDLNTAPPALLYGLMKAAGAGAQADALAQAIVDWRSPVPPGTQSNPLRGRFANIDVLQAVPGFTPALFRRIVPLVTVYSGQASVNTAVAPPGVLLALPGVAPATVQAYVAQRAQALAAGQPVPPLAQAGAYGTGIYSGFTRVRAMVELGHGVSFGRTAVVQIGGNSGAPLRFLAWRETYHPIPAQAASGANAP